MVVLINPRKMKKAGALITRIFIFQTKMNVIWEFVLEAPALTMKEDSFANVLKITCCPRTERIVYVSMNKHIYLYLDNMEHKPHIYGRKRRCNRQLI